MSNEVRCNFCNKLLIRDNEIKCPRCKELVKVYSVGETGLKIAWPDHQQSLAAIKNVLEKWPVELQQQFITALDTFQRSLAGVHAGHQSEAGAAGGKKIQVIPVDIFDGAEIARMSETLKKFNIIPNLKYLREDMEYFKLGLQLVNYFAGINKPEGEKVPLVNIYGFLHEPADEKTPEVPAADPVEAFLMAYWERNMGRFDFDYQGHKVWELTDRDAKRHAIIILTKKFCKNLQERLATN